MGFSNRRRLIVPIAGLFVAVAALACDGSESTPAPTAAAAAAPTAAPTAAPAPTATQPAATQAAPTATQPPSATASSPPEGGMFSWEIDDVGAGTKPALALTSDDVPYVAFMLEASSGFVKNAVLNGLTWETTTIAEGYFYGPLDLAIGPDDIAHITYHDHQDASSFKPDKGDAAYAVQRDGKWRVETAFDEGHDGWDNRITTDSQGRPHMSAIDPQDFGGDGVEYYVQDGSGEWLVESIGSGPVTYKYATSIAVDPQGNPHIAYYDQEDQDLALASRDPSGWSITTVDGEGDTGLFSSLVVDASGRFHVAYLERKSIVSGVVRYATRAPGDTSWEVREVDTLERLTFGTVGARNITSVVVDSRGNPWVAYSDEKTLRLAGWTDSQWQMESVIEDAGLQTLGQLVSLKLDSQDQPHIAYFQVTSRRPLEGIVKYAKGTRK